MNIEIINGVTVLTPSLNYRLTNNVITLEPNQKVYLAKSDSAENWKEISEIELVVWNSQHKDFIMNPNGSKINTSFYYDEQEGEQVVQVDYDTFDYCNGQLIDNINFNYPICRFTYKSNQEVIITLQCDEVSRNLITLNATNKYETVEIELEKPVIKSFEISIGAEKGQHLQGTFFVKQLSLIKK